MYSQFTILSQGCGVGEFQGPADRGPNETYCLCNIGYRKPPIIDCVECLDGVICNSTGTIVPAVDKHYWRYDPTSHDFTKYNLYECLFPNSCRGGYSIDGRCNVGYDDHSPLCAVCANEYVFQNGKCTSCPGYSLTSNITPSTSLQIAAAISLFILTSGIFIFITQTALTSDEEIDLKFKLSLVDLDSLFESDEHELTKAHFLDVLEEHHGGLTGKFYIIIYI